MKQLRTASSVGSTEAKSTYLEALFTRTIWSTSATVDWKRDTECIYTAVLGHHVEHLHVWLFPRYPGTPPELWGTDVFKWRDAPKANGSEIEALCQHIRDHLALQQEDGYEYGAD